MDNVSKPRHSTRSGAAALLAPSLLRRLTYYTPSVSLRVAGHQPAGYLVRITKRPPADRFPFRRLSLSHLVTAGWEL